MTDTSIQRWVASLPEPSNTTAASLLLSMYRPAEVRRIATALARRGNLGCVPFAHTEGDQLVARLLPGKTLADAPIGIAWKSTVDGMTIAPNMKHFVAGRLAQIDCARKSFKVDAQSLKEILDYAGRLGGEKSARAVLDARAEASKAEETRVRHGMLWMSARRFDPLFQALGGAWMFEGEELGAWLQKLRGKARAHPIVVRLRVGYHFRARTGVDVTEDAWSVVNGDHAFDNTYTGTLRGTALGSRKLNALVFAVSWLRENGDDDPRFKSQAWIAAQAAVDDREYDGDAHHRFALELAESDPCGAFTQLANAAGYAAKARSRSITRIIASARDLAKAQQWHELSEILS